MTGLGNRPGVNLPALTDGASGSAVLVGVTWHHLPHATATDWSSTDESVLVDEFASFGLLI